jgi:hypothetical protein
MSRLKIEWWYDWETKETYELKEGEKFVCYGMSDLTPEGELMGIPDYAIVLVED